MATSYGTYSRYPNTFDPVNDPKAPEDHIVFVCGENGARRRSKPFRCKTHGEVHEDDCRACDLHKIALRDNFRGCGAVWRGGDTCYYCQQPHVMEVILPTEAYLRYNGFPEKGIPPSVREARKRLEKEREEL